MQLEWELQTVKEFTAPLRAKISEEMWKGIELGYISEHETMTTCLSALEPPLRARFFTTTGFNAMEVTGAGHPEDPLKSDFIKIQMSAWDPSGAHPPHYDLLLPGPPRPAETLAMLKDMLRAKCSVECTLWAQQQACQTQGIEFSEFNHITTSSSQGSTCLHLGLRTVCRQRD